MCDFGVSDSVLHGMVLFSINGLSQGAYKNNNIITHYKHTRKQTPAKKRKWNFKFLTSYSMDIYDWVD